MVDSNQDGIDDQTGLPVNTAGLGQGGVLDANSLMALAMQGGGGGSAGGATNWQSQFVTNVRQDWQQIKIFTGGKVARKVRANSHPTGGGGRAVEEFQGSHLETIHRPQQLTPFQLLQDFDTWSRGDYLRFKNKLVAAGLLSSSAAPADVRGTYENILKQVQSAQMQLPRGSASEYTPMSLIDNMIRLNGIDPNKIPAKDGWDPASKAKAKSWTQTATSVYDLDPAQAETMLTQMLQQKLGRDPTKAEIQDFADAVKTRSLNDPTTTTTKYHTDANGNTTSNTSTATGFTADDAALLAQKRAENAPDYKSYQAVSTYFPALVQALGATV